MKNFIYKATLLKEIEDLDIDLCPYRRDEISIEKFFATKRDAVRIIQKYFAKRYYNDYIYSWYGEVRRFTLTRNGNIEPKRVYRIYECKI